MDTLISKLIENDLLWIYITIDMSFELLLPAGRLKPKYNSTLSSLVCFFFKWKCDPITQLQMYIPLG